MIFEVLKEPAGSEVRVPEKLKLAKNLSPTVVIFEVLKEPVGREAREPLALKL